jgi:hypothetical protein
VVASAGSRRTRARPKTRKSPPRKKGAKRRKKRKKKRKKEVDVDEVMVQWLAKKLQGTSMTNNSGGEISPTARKFVESLGRFYAFVNDVPDEDMEEEQEEECRRIQKKLKKRGYEIDIQNIRLALTIWGEGSIEIFQYPKAVEVIEQLKGDEEELQKALKGEAVDIVLFIEEIPGV